MKSALVIAKIIVAAVVFLGFLYVSQTTDDPDIWWHLKVGERELQNNSIPHFDEYSFTMSGHRWVDHEWMVDAGLWWVHENNLWWLAAIIFSLLAFLPAYFWIKQTRSFLGLIAVLIASTFMMNVVGIRPQMISVALFFVLFEIIRKRLAPLDPENFSFRSLDNQSHKVKDADLTGFTGGRNYFWLLPILFLIWANLHGGFAVGLAFLGLSIFIHYASLVFKKEFVNFREAGNDFMVILISALATLINPYGVGLYQELYRVMLSSDTVRYIAEWQPVLSLYLFSSVILISLFAVFGLARDFRKLYPAPLFYAAIFMLLLFLKSVRHGSLFLVVAMPFMILGIDKLEGVIFSSEDRRIKNKATAAVFIILVFSFIAFAYRIYRAENYSYPVSAVEFLKKEQQETGSVRIFNDYGWGGYLIYHAPEIKVFIDGRMPHWVDESGEGAMKEMVGVFYDSNPYAWQEVFARRQINTVLKVNDIKTENNFRKKLRKQLLKSFYIKKFYNFVVKEESVDINQPLLENNWKIVYEDDIALIFRCESNDCYGDR